MCSTAWRQMVPIPYSACSTYIRTHCVRLWTSEKGAVDTPSKEFESILLPVWHSNNTHTHNSALTSSRKSNLYQVMGCVKLEHVSQCTLVHESLETYRPPIGQRYVNLEISFPRCLYWMRSLHSVSRCA